MKALSPATPASTTTRPANTPLLGSSPYRLKQVSRIIRHLRDQLQQTQPRLAAPSDSAIESMLESCPAILLSGDDWQQIIGDILSHLSKRFNDKVLAHEPRLHCGRTTTLRAIFDDKEALAFTSALLEHHSQAIC